ncbi:MAG: DUF86 domain-containing protein [Acidobacteriota bacterium]
MRHERLYLEDILTAADAIMRFTMNVSEAEFTQSDLVQSATIQKFSVIGEAASKLPAEFRNRHPGINWKAIIGTRNILVHVYFAVNWHIIWNTIHTELPVLREQITQIMSAEFPDQS